jgi:hypothetical protein
MPRTEKITLRLASLETIPVEARCLRAATIQEAQPIPSRQGLCAAARPRLEKMAATNLAMDRYENPRAMAGW